jgi:peroxiredoxin
MPCVAEFPQLQELARRENELGFRLFGLEIKGYLAMTRDVVRAKKTTFPILLDDRRFARETLHIQGTPTTFVIDGNGRIRARLVGAAPHMQSVIEKILISI